MMKFSKLFIALFASQFTSVYSQCSLTTYTKIAQASNYSGAIKSDGTFWIWGNSYGGNGSGTGNYAHPSQVGNGTDWSQVSAASSYIAALKNDGTLWSFGSSYLGNFLIPTQAGTNTYKAISAGDNVLLAIKTDGTLWATGINNFGGFGNGNYTSALGFVQVGTDTDWASISTGLQHSLAIKNNGTLWATGTNTSGQTGLGTSTNVFTQVGTATNWKQSAAGLSHSLAVKTDGTLWSWGSSADGALGNGTTTPNVSAPTQVGTDTNWVSVGAGNNNSFALKTDFSLWAFGSDASGKLGNGAPVATSTTPSMVIGSSWTTIPVRFGADHSGGIKSDGTLWAWGNDGTYQLGNADGTLTSVDAPTQVTCTDNILAVNDVSNTEKTSILYPNPAKDFIFIKSDQKIKTVDITAITGQFIKSIDVNNNNNNNNNKIDIRDLEAGTYLFTIKSNSSKTVQKVIVK